MTATTTKQSRVLKALRALVKAKALGGATFLSSYQDRRALTPGQMLSVAEALNDRSIAHDPKDFTVSLDEPWEKEQLREMTSEEHDQIAPYMDELEALAFFYRGGWVPSPDQAAALTQCLTSLRAGKETVLVGAAGTGKTTLVRRIIRELGRKAVLVCPTGKAAQRLSRVSGLPASTIHRRLYQEVESDGTKLNFSSPKMMCSKRDLLVVDEASMVGQKLYAEMKQWIPRGTPVLYVGDAEQLEPVRDVWGPDLQKPTARLTHVHRQAEGNPIIDFATAVREGKGNEWLNQQWSPEDERVALFDGKEALAWYMAGLERDEDIVFLTFTHKVRQQINATLRRMRGVDHTVLSPGDRILVRANNYGLGLMNGEILTVKSLAVHSNTVMRVNVEERNTPILVNPRLVEESPSEFWKWQRELTKEERDYRLTHVWYGNCLTVHSSQGSQWDKVGFLWGSSFNWHRKKRPEEARRLLYTAVTRAAKNLAIFAV